MHEGANSKLILVSAPAGFGKTTLVTTWLQGQEQPAAWLSLDESDNSPQRFFTYLLAAMQTVYPDLGRQLLAALHSPRPPADDAVMPALINELAANVAPLILVLDDYQGIQNATIHEALSFFIDYAPPGITLVLTSRQDPPLPLPRWRARGQLVEIRAPDLRFRGTEVPAFLEETMGLQLEKTAVQELAARTEGWVAGLQLAALSIRSSEDAGAFIARFGGSDRQIADYLLQEVLLQQTGKIQQFMLHTSILERFNASLSDHLLAQKNSQAILEELDQSNLFLIPLDNRRVWYRYHHLFAQLLRNRLLMEVSSSDMVRLQRRAAGWYEEQGLLEEAVGHALQIPDFDYAAQLITSIPSESIYEQGNAGIVKEWVRALPEKTVQRYPRTAVLAIAAHMITGDVLGLREYLALIEGDESTQAEQALFNSILVRNNSADSNEALRLAQQARDGFSGKELNLFAAANLQIAVNYINLGQASAAEKILLEQRQMLHEEDVSNLNLLIQVLHMQSGIALENADYYQSQRICQEGLALAEQRTDQRAWPYAALLYTHLARIYYQWHEYKPAAEYLALALEWGKRTGVLDILIESHLLQAELASWQGDKEAVFAAIDEIKDFVKRSWLEDIIEKIEVMTALYQLRTGEVNAAVRWANASGCSLDDKPLFHQFYTYHTLAAVRLTECRQLGDKTAVPAIIGLLDRLLALKSESEHRYDRIESLILKALALDWQGDQEAALEALHEALELALPGSLVRVFVDQGRPMQALLARATHLQPTYSVRILQAFADGPPTEPVKVRPGGTEQVEGVEVPAIHLTNRESEILNLIAAGCSNKEIEEALFISKNTVRTHIKNLYSKLGAVSRTQAVQKAQQLGLL